MNSWMFMYLMCFNPLQSLFSFVARMYPVQPVESCRQASFDTFPAVFGSFFAFWCDKMSQVCFVYFLSWTHWFSKEPWFILIGHNNPNLWERVQNITVTLFLLGLFSEQTQKWFFRNKKNLKRNKKILNSYLCFQFKLRITGFYLIFIFVSLFCYTETFIAIDISILALFQYIKCSDSIYCYY